MVEVDSFVIKEQLQHFLKLLCFTRQYSEVFKRWQIIADNSLLFPTVKDFQNRFTVDEVMQNVRRHHIFLKQGVCAENITNNGILTGFLLSDSVRSVRSPQPVKLFVQLRPGVNSTKQVDSLICVDALFACSLSI